MGCDNVIHCADLSYCQGEGAILHICELDPATDPPDPALLKVLFTNLATGNKVEFPVFVEGYPSLDISIASENFTPIAGHMYQVEVVYQETGGGIFPMKIVPFVWVDGAIDVSDLVYDALMVRFVKVFTQTATISMATEQWLMVPQ